MGSDGPASDGDGGGMQTFDKVLTAIVVGLLMIATALTLRPFLPALLWSIVLAIAAAPMHVRLRRRIPHRPRLAAFLTSLILALILIVPAVALMRAIISYSPGLYAWVEQVSSRSFTGAPVSISAIPMVGPTLSRNWELLAGEGSSYIAHFKSDIEAWLIWAFQEIESVGLFVFEIGLAVVIAGAFLHHLDALSEFANRFFFRIGGPVGVRLLDKSVATTRDTVRAVVGSALAETVVATIAYMMVGVPAWLLLGGLTFFAALIQVGAPLVWIPVAIWLLANDQVGWSVFMVAWGAIVVYGVETLTRPYFVGHSGGELPGLLIFIGVLGGLIAWGVIGVFLGPVILAVAYQLVREWVRPSGAAAFESDRAIPRGLP
jgi:predicted PurR-regulated permease PerM